FALRHPTTSCRWSQGKAPRERLGRTTSFSSQNALRPLVLVHEHEPESAIGDENYLPNGRDLHCRELWRRRAVVPNAAARAPGLRRIASRKPRREAIGAMTQGKRGDRKPRLDDPLLVFVCGIVNRSVAIDAGFRAALPSALAHTGARDARRLD